MTRQRALVTGASSGIGHAIAEQLAKQGYLLTCVARNEENLKKSTAQLGKEHHYFAADLTNKEQLSELCSEISKNKYSLLINNAGQGVYEKFNEVTLERHEHVMILNMHALVALSYTFLKNAKQGDALVNVSSALSRLSFPGGAVYSGTKAFVTNFTESLWYEYKEKGIYILAFLPGYTRTNFHKAALGSERNKFAAHTGPLPEKIVPELMKALNTRKEPSIISGMKYKILVNIGSRLLGRKKMISTMASKSPIFMDNL